MCQAALLTFQPQWSTIWNPPVSHRWRWWGQGRALMAPEPSWRSVSLLCKSCRHFWGRKDNSTDGILSPGSCRSALPSWLPLFTNTTNYRGCCQGQQRLMTAILSEAQIIWTCAPGIIISFMSWMKLRINGHWWVKVDKADGCSK